MNNLILAITLVVAFFMCISAYILGLRHGKELAKGIVPKLNFKQEISQLLPQKKDKPNPEMEGIRNIMSYTGEPQKEGE